MKVPFLDLKAMHVEIAAELDDAWRRAVDTSSFIGGEPVERFEAMWASYCGTAHCVGLSDGTAAIELALTALGVGRGDEVILPANTFFATWEAIVAAGATPVPVDVDPATLLLTAGAVEAAVTPRTAAVVAVHLYGQPCDMDAIGAAARRHGLLVVEDAAQAQGATWRGRRAGGLSDAACFSFYPGKNLGAFGDAGAVVTDRADVAATIRSLSNHGRAPDAADHHINVGDNRRLDALQAAILAVKLPHLDRWNAGRRRAWRAYEDVLGGLPLRLVAIAPGAVSNHHLAIVEVENRDAVRKALADAGVATGIHYRVPCHLHDATITADPPSLPAAERAAGRILSLPMFPHITEAQIARVADVLAGALLPASDAFARAPGRAALLEGAA